MPVNILTVGSNVLTTTVNGSTVALGVNTSANAPLPFGKRVCNNNSSISSVTIDMPANTLSVQGSMYFYAAACVPAKDPKDSNDLTVSLSVCGLEVYKKATPTSGVETFANNISGRGAVWFYCVRNNVSTNQWEVSMATVDPAQVWGFWTDTGKDNVVLGASETVSNSTVIKLSTGGSGAGNGFSSVALMGSGSAVVG
jgi:hypothetical protein